ncbi:MAG: hypothetical protein PVF43_02190 [Candidatus Eiseniibacteriota bacterium]|jgi:hypothetical protein
MEQTATRRLDGSALTLPAGMDRWRRPAFGIGLAGAVLLVVGVLVDPTQFFRSYLLGVLLWLGVAVGSLGLVMLHHLTGGAWGLAVRRVLEASVGTIPAVALLFVPLLLGLGHVYPWADPASVSGDAILEHKAPYLNSSGFVVRAAIYFAIWIIVGTLLRRWSASQDGADPGTAESLKGRMRALSAPGIVIFCVTITFAGFDWLMSLEPHWFSSIYGIYMIGCVALSGLAFTVIIASALARREPMSRHLGAAHFNDYGNLMLAFIMLWAYFALSQFLIIWSGNLPEEIGWYLARLDGGWQRVGLLLVIAHFALPFLLLLSRRLKRSARVLAWLAAGVLVMRWVDLVWQTVPSHHPDGLTLHWLDLVAPVAVGGIWLGVYLTLIARRPLLPVGAPDIGEAVHHG